jgi:hypothetical protein
MTTKRKYYTWVLSSALLLGLLGSVSVAWSQDDNPPSVLPVVGIAGGEVLRVAIAAAPRDDPRGGDQRCMATIGFMDTRTGDLVGEVRRFDLGSGETDFVDLSFRTLRLRFRQRADVQPMLIAEPASDSCDISYTVLRIGRVVAYDSLRGYSIFGQGSDCAPAPSSLIGLILGPGIGQTMQYTVARTTQPVGPGFDPLPCDITVNLREGNSIVASLVTGPLAPGAMTSVAVNSNSLSQSNAVLDEEIIDSVVQVSYPGGRTCPVRTSEGCIISRQVRSNFTLWTTVLDIP